MKNKFIPKLIKDNRRLQNMSQSELGKALGILWQGVSNIERGFSSIPIKKVTICANALKISEYEILKAMALDEINKIADAKELDLGDFLNAIIYEFNKMEVLDDCKSR